MLLRGDGFLDIFYHGEGNLVMLKMVESWFDGIGILHNYIKTLLKLFPKIHANTNTKSHI